MREPLTKKYLYNLPEQKSSAWHQARTGKVRGSEVIRAMGKLQRKSGSKVAGDWNADHDNFCLELAWELITLTATDHYVSKPMMIGEQYESESRIEFGMQIGAEVEQTGFVPHPELDSLFGASPDGYVIENGIFIPIEGKVPLLKTHEGYISDDVVPSEYVPQLQSEMNCMDRAPYGYFYSYAPPELYPELPDEFRMFIKKLPANPGEHTEEAHPFTCTCWICMEAAVVATMEKATSLVKELTARYPRNGKPISLLTQQFREAVEYEGISDADVAWAQAGFTKENANGN